MRFFGLLLITCFAVNTAYSQKNVRIGFLDIDRVLSSHKGFGESSQELDTKIDEWRNEIEIRQKELDAQKEALALERPLLTDEIAEEREEDIAFEQEKLDQYIEKRFGVEGDWIKQKVTLAQPAQDEILTAIREIATDRKLDFVFDSTSDILVLHSEKKYDISDLVIRYLEIEDKKQAKAFLAESKKEERQKRTNPALEERRKALEKRKAERLKLLEERKAARKQKKNATNNSADRKSNDTSSEKETKEDSREARKAKLEQKKKEREEALAKRKKEQAEALAKRKKERLEELERRKKELEEKRKQAQLKK